MDDVRPELDVPRYFVDCLARAYSVIELRRILHDVELEEFAADYWDLPEVGFYQQLASTLRQAIPYRFHIDRWRRMRTAKSRLIRQPKRIDFQGIKDRIDIVEYIGRYVELRHKGRDWWACCPFHAEKTPSFKVSREYRGFHCFSCGAKGDIFTFHRLMGGKGRPE